MCRDLANVTFHLRNGRDLTPFDDRSFDLILAIDSIPCMFAADPEIAARHVRDCARRLRSGGTLLILNFSYRGDEADRRDVQQLAAANGIYRSAFRDTRFLIMGRACFFAQASISPRINASVLARAS